MKGASRLIMGTTLVMVMSVAILLGLLLVLFAELYCSLLLRRRNGRRNSPTSTSTSTAAPSVAAATNSACGQRSGTPPPSSLGSFFAPGVLNAPRNLLFPAVSPHDKVSFDLEKQQPNNSSLRSFLSPPFPPPKLVYEVPHHPNCSTNGYDDDVEVCGGRDGKESYIYICNPIYYSDRNRGVLDTPFQTPDSSPARLFVETSNNGSSGSSSGDGEDVIVNLDVQSPDSGPIMTPPLTPMKKLPAQACSVSLRDAGSLATSGSESNSNNGGISSTLSFGSPTASPSW